MLTTKRIQEKTAVGRLVLCKAFLAVAAVCLDSAARRCRLLLRFCVRKTVPGFGHENQPETVVNNFYEKALACTENILTVLDRLGDFASRISRREFCQEQAASRRRTNADGDGLTISREDAS
jgi:hypothetical protein